MPKAEPETGDGATQICSLVLCPGAQFVSKNMATTATSGVFHCLSSRFGGFKRNLSPNLNNNKPAFTRNLTTVVPTRESSNFDSGREINSCHGCSDNRV